MSGFTRYILAILTSGASDVSRARMSPEFFMSVVFSSTVIKTTVYTDVQRYNPYY